MKCTENTEAGTHTFHPSGCIELLATRRKTNPVKDFLHEHVETGALPGAVALVAHGDQVEVAAAGSVDVDGILAPGSIDHGHPAAME